MRGDDEGKKVIELDGVSFFFSTMPVCNISLMNVQMAVVC